MKEKHMAALVQKGDTISVHYTGRLADGDIFDSSEGREPLKFTVGAGQMIPGFDAAVVGMAQGDKKTVSIAPDQAYGERSDDFLFDFPRANVPEGMEVEEGMQVYLQDNAGNPLPATVVSIGEETLKMDCNHPLAGKTLVFDISIAETGLKPDAGSCAPSSCGSCGCGCGS
jgi:peptidylprolyl isomerase